MNKNLTLVVGVILVTSIFAIAFVEARTAPNTVPSINHMGSKPKIIKSQGSAVQTPSRSSGGGCITQWGWNGKEWVLRDLFRYDYVVVSGQKCTPFDMHTKKITPKPTTKGNANTAYPLPANWPNSRHKNLW